MPDIDYYVNMYKFKIPKDEGLSEEVLKRIGFLNIEGRDFALSLCELQGAGRGLTPSLIDFYSKDCNYHSGLTYLFRRFFKFYNTGVFCIEGIPFTFDDCDFKSAVEACVITMYYNATRSRAMFNIDIDSILERIDEGDIKNLDRKLDRFITRFLNEVESKCCLKYGLTPNQTKEVMRSTITLTRNGLLSKYN